MGVSARSTRSGKRRIAITVVLLFAIVALFVVRLVDIQVVRADTLSADSLGNRSVEQPIYGSRGDIVDANGVVLAGTVMRYNITLSPRNAVEFTRKTAAGDQTVTVAQAAAEVGAITGQTGDAILAIISSSLAADPASDYAIVTKAVDVSVFRAVDALEIPWIYFEKKPGRVYPDGAVAGNLVGFTSSEGEAQAGLELGQDSCLASTNGTETYEKGADGVRLPQSTVTEKAAVDGGDVVTTIDSDLEWFVQQALAKQAQATGAAWGTVVVQEVKTGKLVAVADYPSVDPNNVNGTANPDDRGSRAFTASFEPGSTFKALTAASVLDAGKATVGTQVVAPYRYLPGNGANINDSSGHADLHLTLTGVLIESSNTGMSKFGELLTDKQRYDYMTKFGLGTETEAGFPAEDTGILHPYDEWDPQTKYATMFGQGLTTTALQVSSIYQTIANKGVRMPVQLVAGCRQADGTMTNVPAAAGTQVVSASAAHDTSDMLEMVYQKAWLSKVWNIPGYRVATKTGTAQMPDGHGGYTHGYLVSVSGFAPADDPEYVVSVSLADPVKLNTSAAPAPIFQEVMSQVLKKYRAVPSGAPAPALPGTW
ncbi:MULTISPECIES: peptidoglycan D,D-transpeptidase FtsI family protein [Cryobacterium]|uniref:Penicillin-binding protein 2 n=1 Tax=Cryobacterium zhongshanensis TaxID=2928153 RepID=A0AA41UFX7_9MICO|nr:MULTISPECIES: penicillin-binding protein 2 [Cryobacterium]MCI4658612.1 penicillin-binding protein 2 [Cryobacterium zhongshanensis]